MTDVTPATSSKSFLVTWILSLLLGTLGIDRFYLGKIGTGILKLITVGGLGLWSLIDLIIVLTGNQKDKAGRALEGYDANKKIAWIVSIVFVLFGGVIGSISSFASMNS